MTKADARKIMSAEILKCAARHFEKMPENMNIDKKDNKVYISFKGPDVYICFYVTSSLAYSYTCSKEKASNILLIDYDYNRDEKELKKMINQSFKHALRKIDKKMFYYD